MATPQFNIRQSAVQIDENELRFLFRRLNKVAKEMGDDDWRRKTMRGAANLVVGAARANAPRSNKPHYVYHTGRVKFIKSRRAARGSATEYRTKYYPGNLQLSIQYLEKLKKTPAAIIGPRILRRARAKSYGKSPNRANGFYAQFIYGSAKAFRDNVMIPALVAQTSRVLRYVDEKMAQRLRKVAKRENLAA